MRSKSEPQRLFTWHKCQKSVRTKVRKFQHCLYRVEEHNTREATPLNAPRDAHSLDLLPLSIKLFQKANGAADRSVVSNADAAELSVAVETIDKSTKHMAE